MGTLATLGEGSVDHLFADRCSECLTGTIPFIRAGGPGGALVGMRYPVKVGAGGRLQPYNPANGRFLGFDANPGLSNSATYHGVVGVGQGVLADPVNQPPQPRTRAQALGQLIGRILGQVLKGGG